MNFKQCILQSLKFWKSIFILSKHYLNHIIIINNGALGGKCPDLNDKTQCKLKRNKTKIVKYFVTCYIIEQKLNAWTMKKSVNITIGKFYFYSFSMIGNFLLPEIFFRIISKNIYILIYQLNLYLKHTYYVHKIKVK